MMSFVLSLLISTASAECPVELASATATLEEARVQQLEARKGVYDEDWDFRLNTEDRDQVLREQQEARDALRAAKAALREARNTAKSVARQYPADQRVCRLDQAPTAG